jgi:undecaprenyl-diphosphatase
LSLLQAVVLGVLQGATEFLPVSSSGHLVLVPWLLRWQSPGLVFDAVVHWGTALAVIIYFWKEWVALIRGAVSSLLKLGRPSPRPEENPEEEAQAAIPASLAWLILLGTIPGVLAGYFLEDFFEAMFARPAAAAGFLLVTALLLTASERLSGGERGLVDLAWLDALIVGTGQALAILPGISRSGSTIAAGLVQGMKREPAAHFSFLLATPIIIGAGLLKVVELAQAGDLVAEAPVLLAGFVAAALVGFGCIHFLLRYLQRHRLYPFALYCSLFGILSLLVWAVR